MDLKRDAMAMPDREARCPKVQLPEGFEKGKIVLRQAIGWDGSPSPHPNFVDVVRLRDLPEVVHSVDELSLAAGGNDSSFNTLTDSELGSTEEEAQDLNDSGRECQSDECP